MLRSLEEIEVANVVLDDKEYEASQWLEPQVILDGDFHPAVKFATRALLASQKWAELRAAIAAHPSNDVEVAALARQLAALAADPPAGTSDYRVVAPALQYECGVDTAL